MPRKKCTGCGEVKDYAEFTLDRSRKDGRQCKCKSCNRRYREENRESINERRRRHYEENREAILEGQRQYREENWEAFIERQRRYYEEHREVLNEIGRLRREKINEAMREIVTRNGEPWTPAEDSYILSSDEPAAIMAMELGRTITAVRIRTAMLRKKTAA